MKRKIAGILALTLIIATATIPAAATKQDDNTPPEVNITKPTNALYILGIKIPILLQMPLIIGRITITVDAHDNESGMDRVECYINDELMATDEEPPYEILWHEAAFGERTIKVIAYDPHATPHFHAPPTQQNLLNIPKHL
jgi:hypothetical protein